MSVDAEAKVQGKPFDGGLAEIIKRLREEPDKHESGQHFASLLTELNWFYENGVSVVVKRRPATCTYVVEVKELR